MLLTTLKDEALLAHSFRNKSGFYFTIIWSTRNNSTSSKKQILKITTILINTFETVYYSLR